MQLSSNVQIALYKNTELRSGEEKKKKDKNISKTGLDPSRPLSNNEEQREGGRGAWQLHQW